MNALFHSSSLLWAPSFSFCVVFTLQSPGTLWDCPLDWDVEKRTLCFCPTTGASSGLSLKGQVCRLQSKKDHLILQKANSCGWFFPVFVLNLILEICGSCPGRITRISLKVHPFSIQVEGGATSPSGKGQFLWLVLHLLLQKFMWVLWLVLTKLPCWAPSWLFWAVAAESCMW